MLTDVYNVFPFTTVARLSNHTTVTISEPETPTSTRFFGYRLGAIDPNDEGTLERAVKDASFVADTGLLEDQAAIREIQTGLASGANEHFTYGRFEQAIVHFHKHLHACLDELTACA